MPKVTMPEPVAVVNRLIKCELSFTPHGVQESLSHGAQLHSTAQMEAYAAAKVREALKLATATVAKGINERSSLIANVTRRNAASEILNLIN